MKLTPKKKLEMLMQLNDYVNEPLKDTTSFDLAEYQKRVIIAKITLAFIDAIDKKELEK
jgi:hypothetical protein